jgi:hypothetical protein
MEVDGSTPDPNTKTALQLDLVEPHMIALSQYFWQRDIKVLNNTLGYRNCLGVLIAHPRYD